MKHLFKKVLFVLFLLISSISFAQDTVKLLDGKEIIGDIVVEDKAVVGMHIPKPLRPKNLNFYYKYDMFSIAEEGKPERIVYKQNNLLGFPFTEDEMRRYVNGERFARKTFKSGKYFWMGFGINLTGSVLTTYRFRDNTPFGKPARFIPHIVMVGSTPTLLELLKPEMHKPETLDLVEDPYYYSGYSEIVLGKIRVSSGFGSLLGMTTGIALHFRANP
jgi:hypothetical protein